LWGFFGNLVTWKAALPKALSSHPGWFAFFLRGKIVVMVLTETAILIVDGLQLSELGRVLQKFAVLV
jgi:hypothetical protein